MLTRPTSVDSAPYVVALVASSWKASTSAWAWRGETAATRALPETARWTALVVSSQETRAVLTVVSTPAASYITGGTTEPDPPPARGGRGHSDRNALRRGIYIGSFTQACNQRWQTGRITPKFPSTFACQQPKKAYPRRCQGDTWPLVKSFGTRRCPWVPPFLWLWPKAGPRPRLSERGAAQGVSRRAKPCSDG